MARSTSTSTLTVDGITTIASGETPWSYASEPGFVPGPWGGEDAAAIIAAFESIAGVTVVEYWDRIAAGKGLWAIVRDATS